MSHSPRRYLTPLLDLLVWSFPVTAPAAVLVAVPVIVRGLCWMLS